MDPWQGWNKINHSIISWLCYTPIAFQKLQRGGVAMAMHYSIGGIHGWPVSFIDLFALVVRWSPPKSWSRLWYSGNGWWSPDSFCIKEKIQPIHQSEKDIGSLVQRMRLTCRAAQEGEQYEAPEKHPLIQVDSLSLSLFLSLDCFPTATSLATYTCSPNTCSLWTCWST